MVNYYQLAVLLGLVLAVALPIVFVTRAARRRRRAIDAGELVITDRFNTLAIVAFVAVFIGALPGVVVGHIALSQIRRTHERGWGLAVAALCIGYASIAFTLLFTIAFVIAAASQQTY